MSYCNTSVTRYACVLLWGILAVRVAGGTPPVTPRPSYGLLVGCSRYYRNPVRSLEGPANDVVLMRELLERRFGFAPRDIVTLAESREDEFKPTKANIKREFLALVDKVKAHRGAGAKPRVVIYLSGHGTSQPDSEASPGGKDEADGRDEVFLPADIGVWNRDKGTVENAIVDDELGTWTRAIAQQGAHLWVIVDACHSGSSLRDGGAAEVARQVKPETLGIPERAVHGSDEEKRVKNSGWHEETAGNYVAFYASLPDEKAVERIPYGSRERKKYGLFTHTLARVLAEAKTPLTYHELLQQVQSKYRTWGRDKPHPVVVGNMSEHVVLEENRGRTSLVLMKVGGQLRIDAGRLQGVTMGSVFSVHPRAGASDGSRVLGYVQVRTATLFSADVVPVPFNGMPEPEKERLVDGCRCELARVDWGDLQLTIGVDQESAKVSAGLPTEERQQLLRQAADRMREWTRKGEMPFRFVEDWTSAEWVLTWRGGELCLVPDFDTVTLAKESRDSLWRPVRIESDDIDRSLRESLAKVARVQNLIRLAGTSVWCNLDDDRVLKVELQLRDRRTDKPLVAGEKVADGQMITWQIVNDSSVPVYAELFYIDVRYGIRRIKRAIDAIRPHGSSDLYAASFEIRHGGIEYFLLVATRKVGHSPPPNFAGLTQPALELLAEKSLKRSGTGTPLERLLYTAAARTRTRSSQLTDPGSCVIQLFPVVTVPEREEQSADK